MAFWSGAWVTISVVVRAMPIPLRAVWVCPKLSVFVRPFSLRRSFRAEFA